MLSPQALRNGGTPSPHRRIPTSTTHQFHSTVSEQKLRRFNSLILVFRLATFCFSLASSVFMLTNSRGSSSPHWYDFDTFRFVFAANAIVAVYSLFEMVVSVWEISRGATLLPEILQVWFDFGHDQVFAYLLLSANSAGIALAKALRRTDTCTDTSAFCIQSDISIALGFAGFLFLGFSSLLSGFRVVSFIINGSRFHL
ncbi:CASP-like protein 4C2 isoform X2 [Juglans microcarpa x Juglans regia]|uniref:CASP-like protein 4C2 isoform X2 n=1 Tax=Juglans microcarpa x Juglans regia TaxID=2249226 RepID=UPI001B7E910A|nr:CASP-like protein 4C2 isoform X2 [Juglans microcarpa x Juglans regia]